MTTVCPERTSQPRHKAHHKQSQCTDKTNEQLTTFSLIWLSYTHSTQPCTGTRQLQENAGTVRHATAYSNPFGALLYSRVHKVSSNLTRVGNLLKPHFCLQ
jgi:hypothetical protein